MSDNNSSGDNDQENRRGGRKRAVNEDHLTEEQKTKKQKNRDAAKKCRQRKLEEANTLKKQNDELDQQNKRLTKKKCDLEAKIENCLMIINQHIAHGCQLPADVQNLLDNNNSTYSDQLVDICPVGIHTTGNTYQNDHHLSKQDVDDNADIGGFESKVPTGLFSGTQLDQGALRKEISTAKAPLALQTSHCSQRDETAFQNLPLPVQSSEEFQLKQSSSFGNPNEHVLWQEDKESQFNRSSPVQRVPNIDLLRHSSQQSPGYESVEDDDALALRSVQEPSHFNIVNQSVNYSGGYIVNKTPSQFSQDIVNSSKETINCIKPIQGESGPINPMLMNLRKTHRNDQSSVTESLQVTTELISQAIHDINPSDISGTLKAQIVECTKTKTEINNPSLNQVNSSTAENNTDIHTQTVIYEQRGNTSNAVGVAPPSITYSFYDNNEETTNSNVMLSNAAPMPQTYTDAPQNYVVLNPNHLQQLGLLMKLNAQPEQQAIQLQEEVVLNSQIPTTVLEDNETPEQPMSEPVATTSTSRPVTVNVENFPDFAQNVADLPSLSFNDLKNQPKEIFEKKPSRLNGQSTK